MASTTCVASGSFLGFLVTVDASDNGSFYQKVLIGTQKVLRFDRSGKLVFTRHALRQQSTLDLAHLLQHILYYHRPRRQQSFFKGRLLKLGHIVCRHFFQNPIHLDARGRCGSHSIQSFGAAQKLLGLQGHLRGMPCF
jgi:hypothetical protein